MKRNPRRRVMSITYGPKLKAVFETGLCKQTIRINRDFKVGDFLLLHDWTGRPYRSKWGRRLQVVISEIWDVVISTDGIRIKAVHNFNTSRVVDSPVYPWDSKTADALALLDYIHPPTGEGLRAVLYDLNKLPRNVDHPAQVIRWEPTTGAV